MNYHSKMKNALLISLMLGTSCGKNRMAPNAEEIRVSFADFVGNPVNRKDLDKLVQPRFIIPAATPTELRIRHV